MSCGCHPIEKQNFERLILHCHWITNSRKNEIMSNIAKQDKIRVHKYEFHESGNPVLPTYTYKKKKDKSQSSAQGILYTKKYTIV